jgi:hypothetical protein
MVEVLCFVAFDMVAVQSIVFFICVFFC